ncbi:MAG: hypothetical protein JXM71_03215, partial [Spirochaetales bacterium]|nr:hypothetical protein [Spirochaetales bacterium]
MSRSKMTLLLLAAAVSLAVIVVESRLVPYSRAPQYGEMVEAAAAMRAATRAVGERRLALGLGIDPVTDPNGTGFIGVEYSGMTTSLGELAAKRTTT